jgi:hypothetical protein
LIEQGSASISFNEFGDGCVGQLAREPSRGSGLAPIIEEDLLERIVGALSFLAWLFDRIDPTRRLEVTAVAASLVGAQYSGWRTRAEHQASPNSMTLSITSPERPVVDLGELLPRDHLASRAEELGDDLMILLRRKLKG